ncbi:MerR family transcriptional regulator [Chloroflexi bacterium TSY]|nr:MerR family transcriptional regulator [Chloroflexi bacterium TSY]
MKAVVQQTGLKPDTLRAWERRYGLPNPRRTESGHRLYSQQDIAVLQWLIARQNEGLSISRAAALLHRMKAKGGKIRLIRLRGGVKNRANSLFKEEAIRKVIQILKLESYANCGYPRVLNLMNKAHGKYLNKHSLNFQSKLFVLNYYKRESA